MGHEGKVGFTHQRGFRHIANHQRACNPLTGGLFKCGQRIRRLARLGNRNNQRAFPGRMPPVAVFTRYLDLTGNPNVFQPVLCHESRMVAGTTGDDLNLSGGVKDLLCAAAERFLEHVITQQSPFQGVRNRSGLFVNFFLHEVAILTQLGAVARLRAGVNRPYRNFSGAIADKTLCSADIRNVTVFKYLVLSRHRQQSVDIRRHKIFPIGAAQQQGGALTGSHKPARFTSMHHRK